MVFNFGLRLLLLGFCTMADRNEEASLKCTAAGAGVWVCGGYAGSPTSFILTVKDSDGRKIPNWGGQIVVKVIPGVEVGGSDIDGVVMDHGDGTYSVTYVVPNIGNYMVNVECNGFPIMGSPFPVFFSAGNANGGLLDVAPTTSYPNLVDANVPNMPNYAGSVSGSFSGLGGMIPGLVPGPSEGVLLHGIAPVCPEFLNGQCFKTDCNLKHPKYTLLMTAIEETAKRGTMSQVPMAPSAASMAAAKAIRAAQALQAHAAQQAHSQSSQSSKDSTGASEKDKAEMLKRTVQVSNLVPNVTADHLKRLFGVRGTVVECTITDPEHFAYIEYSKPEQATAALALNTVELGGRLMKVEMAKSLPPKPASPQPLKSKSRSISRSPVNSKKRHRSRSVSPMYHYRNRRSKSPIRSRHRSRSLSPKTRHSRHHRSRSPALHRHYSSYDRQSYRDVSDRFRKRDSYGSRDYHGSASIRHIGRSPSPRGRESYRDRSDSPKYRHRSSKHLSKSPDHHRGGRSSPRNDDERKSKQRHRLRSRSVEDRDKSSKRTEGNREITHHGRRRSRSVSCEKKLHSGDRLTPGISDDNMPTRRKRSKSRCVEAKHNSDERVNNSKHRKRNHSRSVDGDTRRRLSNEKHKYKDKRRPRSNSVEDDRKAETRKRNRSRSADRETNRRVSHAKRKSVDGRRSRSKSVEGGLKDETREEKHRRRSRNRSRSVSAEPNSHSGGKSSRHRDVKMKSKHRRASRSNSPDGKAHERGDGSAIMKSNFGSSTKHESDAENDGSPSLKPMLDGSDFDRSDIAPESLSGNRDISAEPERSN